jgi:hypothetical protein
VWFLPFVLVAMFGGEPAARGTAGPVVADSEGLTPELAEGQPLVV